MDVLSSVSCGNIGERGKITMKKFLILLAVILMPAGVHAASQVWCPGYVCSQLSNYCDHDWFWCTTSYPSYNGYTLANGNYKYCVPRFGMLDGSGDLTSTSMPIVCYSDLATCQAIQQGTVPWIWDYDNHQSYMHPESGYFFSCGTTAKYLYTSDSLDIYACAPGFYQSRGTSYPLVRYSDSTETGSGGCNACSNGTYSRGRTYSCKTCPSNATCTGTYGWQRGYFTCNSGYYGKSVDVGQSMIGTESCTACPTADSGWTRTSDRTFNTTTKLPNNATYTGCYEYQTPTGCAEGSVRRWGSSSSAYSSTIQLEDTLSADLGYYTTSSSATSCTRCPSQGGIYGTTDEEGASSPTECFIEDEISLTDTTGTYEYTNFCYYCMNMCSAASECQSIGYGTCTNGCCANACSSSYGCASVSDCQSHGYSQCSGGCCTYQCSSGVYGANQFQCQIQNYGTSTNGCCSNNCGTRGTCTTNANCYANGYKTCSSGCCSGTQCASGKACASNSDCPSAYPTCTSNCCVANTSCTYGSCTSNSDCLNSTCNTSTGCCRKPTVGGSCLPTLANCQTDRDCVAEAPVGFNCSCTCSAAGKCMCVQELLKD